VTRGGKWVGEHVNQDPYSLRLEVPTNMAILHKFARHSRHKTNDDFLALMWDSKD
jgi:hypothetical protein